MANTDVVLRDELGLRVPSDPELAVVPADTVTITVEDGANSVLYFSPETAAILSPKPGARVDLDFGQKLTYTFEVAKEGAFGVITQAPEVSAPDTFDFGPPSDPPVLMIRPGQGTNYGGPTNNTQT